MNQVEINFEAGLLDQFPEFRDVVKASVYSCGRAFKSVAADLDMSPSILSRKLTENNDDPVHFPLSKLPERIRATGDKRPIYWLIESFLEDQEKRRNRAIDSLAELLPTIAALVKESKSEAKLKVAS